MYLYLAVVQKPEGWCLVQVKDDETRILAGFFKTENRACQLAGQQAEITASRLGLRAVYTVLSPENHPDLPLLNELVDENGRYPTGYVFAEHINGRDWLKLLAKKEPNDEQN
jgi:hypothetical protein